MQIDTSNAGDRAAMTWIVVNTHAHKEELALDNLRRQGFVTYCPRIARRQLRRGRGVDVARPMFPGYVFVRVSRSHQHWRPILSTYGVRRLMRCGNSLSVLDDEFVQALRSREVGGVIARPAHPLEVGQQIQLVAGPFDGLIATILSVDDKDRLTLLLDMLGGPIRLRVGSVQNGSQQSYALHHSASAHPVALAK